jgi:hypothetical protein
VRGVHRHSLLLHLLRSRTVRPVGGGSRAVSS